MGANDARSLAYRELYRLAQGENDYEEAFTYALRFHNLRDSLTNQEKDRNIREMTERYNSAKANMENERLKIELDNRKKERYGILAIGTLLAIVAFLVWNRQRHGLKQAQKLHEQEKEILKTREALTSSELLHAREALDRNKESMESYMRSVLEKNNLIENLEAQIKAIEVKDNRAETERATRLNELRQMKILTEENWRSFRHHFEQVYHGFLDRLVKQYPDLTKGERRLFVLIKLNLGTSEMADILGISADSVKKARYRLRKKLQLSENQPLTQFIQTFK